MAWVKCRLCNKVFEEGVGIAIHFGRKHKDRKLDSHVVVLDPNLPDDAILIGKAKARKAEKRQSRKKSRRKRAFGKKSYPKSGPKRRKQRVLKRGKRAATTPQATEIVIPLMLRIPIIMGEAVIETLKI